MKEIERESDDEHLSHEAIPQLVIPVEDKEAEHIKLATAIKARVDEFLDGAKALKCSGQIPNNFIELSKYQPEIKIQAK